MPVQRLSCPSYTQPLQTPACCYRTAAVRCALPVKRTTERELQDMTGKVQGDNEQVKEGGQSQRQRRRQCGHQTSAPRSPSPPELPSFAQMRAELKEHGTANNPGVLLTSVRLLHDKLLTSFPSTSSLPASPQQPSWPQPGHAQNNEPPQDEKTTDRWHAFTAITLLARGIYPLVPTMGPVHLARLYSLLVNASHRSILRMHHVLEALHGVQGSSPTTSPSSSTGSSKHLPSIHPQFMSDTQASPGKYNSGGRTAAQAASSDNSIGLWLEEGRAAFAALIPRMHEHALSLMGAGHLAGWPLRTVLVGMAELQVSLQPPDMAHIVQALLDDVRERRLHPGGHVRAIAAAARIAGISALPPDLLTSMFRALQQPLKLAAAPHELSERDKQQLGLSPQTVVDLVWVAGQMQQYQRHLKVSVQGQPQQQGREQQSRQQADLEDPPAVFQWYTTSSTYSGQLHQACGILMHRYQPPQATDSAGLIQQEARSARWAAAVQAWTDITPFLVTSRLESVLLSLDQAKLAQVLGSWHLAGMPTSRRTLRRLLLVSSRLLEPDSPPLPGSVLAQLSCVALVTPSEQQQQQHTSTDSYSDQATAAVPEGSEAVRKHKELLAPWLLRFCRKAEEGLGKLTVPQLRTIIASLAGLQLRLGPRSSLRLFPQGLWPEDTDTDMALPHSYTASKGEGCLVTGGHVIQQLADPSAPLSPATLCLILQAVGQPSREAAAEQPSCIPLLKTLVLRCMAIETVITSNLVAAPGQLLMYAHLMADAACTGSAQAVSAVPFAEPHRFTGRPLAGDPAPQAADLVREQLPLRAEQLLAYFHTLISTGAEPNSVLKGAAAVAVVRLAKQGPHVLSLPQLCSALQALARVGVASKSSLWKGTVLGIAQSHLTTASTQSTDWNHNQQSSTHPLHNSTTEQVPLQPSTGHQPCSQPRSMRPLLTLLRALVAVRIMPGVAFEAAFYSALQSQHLDAIARLDAESSTVPGAEPQLQHKLLQGDQDGCHGSVQLPYYSHDPVELSELLDLMGEAGLPGNAQLLSSIQAVLCSLIDKRHPRMSAQLALRQVQALLNLATMPTPRLFSKVGKMVLQHVADDDTSDEQSTAALLQQLCSVTQAVAGNPLLGSRSPMAVLKQEARNTGAAWGNIMQLQAILTSCTTPAQDQGILVREAQQLLSQIADLDDSWQDQSRWNGGSLSEPSPLANQPLSSTRSGKIKRHQAEEASQADQHQDIFDAFIDQQLRTLKEQQRN